MQHSVMEGGGCGGGGGGAKAHPLRPPFIYLF